MQKIQERLIKVLNSELSEIYSENERTLKSELKNDMSIVTEIDLLVSDFIKKEMKDDDYLKSFNFLSEEDINELKFPIVILDPIDGTREFSKGIGECAVSFAAMKNSNLYDPSQLAWIYNPLTGFSFDTSAKFTRPAFFKRKNLFGMVSRSEYALGLFNNSNSEELRIVPRGSIAFKLGLLASGACDFVVSKNPKNIWDIAAGTILAIRSGFHFYVDGKRIENLEQEKYSGILLWCREEELEHLMYAFQK